MKDKPLIWPNSKGLSKALDHIGAKVRYNIRSDQVEVTMPGEDRWEQSSIRGTESKLREIISEWCLCAAAHKKDGTQKPMHFGAYWSDAFGALCYDSRVDPFRQYLSGLKEWDGVNRLDDWMTRAGFVLEESQDEGLVKWCQRFVFCGAVARTYEPGMKLDEVPVLSSERGGLAKSFALRLMFPDHLANLFGDSIDFSASDKVRLEATLGKVIVEVSEMNGILSGAKSDTVKAFISRTNDNGVRLAWRQDAQDMPRRFILVGTCDTGNPLPDEENLRRFVVLQIADGNPRKTFEYLNEHRELLWAEAKSVYMKRGSPRLPDALKAAQAETNERMRMSVDYEIEIGLWLDKWGNDPFRLLDLARGIEAVRQDDTYSSLSKSVREGICKQLRRLGYTNRVIRIEGKNAKLWRKTSL